MPTTKKLQVFVSSTFTDLEHERQAAVEAILAAGHIPAGMELFAAGDKLQMKVIEKWIDDSDVYLLILGIRYGSIEPDSGKSYTHLEYEYALKHNKALFVCVIDEQEQKDRIKNGIEEEHSDKLQKFRDLVCCDKVVSFWKDFGELKYAILHSMAMDFAKREELGGWVRIKPEESSEDIQSQIIKEPQNPQPPNEIIAQRSNNEEFEFEVVKVDATGKIYKRHKHKAKQQIENVYGINLEMVYIPAGEFMMGSNERKAEQPIHKVTIKQPFYMGKYPITQAQWIAIMGNNPSSSKGDNRPVERVSWDDAVKFCEKLSNLTNQTYRLPSEAEWEYACRAGTTTKYYFGETISDKLANYGKNVGKTTDVGNYPANSFGLYDMYGNVWEWCVDYYQDNYNNAPTDGSVCENTSKYRVLRGGSWSYDSLNVRSANRFRLNVWYNVIGFRVVR